MRAAVALTVAVAAALVLPGASAANGDPASDVLITNDVFFPYAGVSSQVEMQAKEALKAAKKRGYRVRLAVIGAKGDLGLAPSFFRRPHQYARFLWEELSFSYKGNLLVVMPNGFGFYSDGGKGITEADRKLSRIEIDPDPDGLSYAGASGVRVLAGLKPLPPRSKAGSTRDRILIGAGALLIAAFLAVTVWLYRRAGSGAAEQAA